MYTRHGHQYNPNNWNDHWTCPICMAGPQQELCLSLVLQRTSQCTWPVGPLAKCRTATKRYIHHIPSLISKVDSNDAFSMRGAQKRRHLQNALPIGTATKTWNERRLCRLTVYIYISLQLKFRGFELGVRIGCLFGPGRFFGLSCETIHHAGGVSPTVLFALLVGPLGVSEPQSKPIRSIAALPLLQLVGSFSFKKSVDKS